ncbi:EVE domain-containing protein [Clavibacter zhangzhiyongii]|uniref:EVE domain-containing protein n=1 Tax=Clavibacter zhangzhiyongii TaxID=2768071 RepID=UPI001F356553|nr:EVE domain-containing protein [Clavibacter zhangzhiyongii]
MIRYWVGVVSRDRVLDGLDLGIAQVNRGAREPVERLGEADGFVYYSPRESYPDGQLLRAFTAIGRVADAAPYQGRVGEWRPWRRRMDWDLGASTRRSARSCPCSTSPATPSSGAGSSRPGCSRSRATTSR